MRVLHLSFLALTVGLASCGTLPATQAPVLGAIDDISLSTAVGTQATRELSITNTGNAPLTYALTLQNAPWLQVTRGETGTVAAGKTAQVGLQATCGQEAGRFNGTLTVNPTGLTAVNVPVTLTCTADTTPEAFAFAAQRGVAAGAAVTSNTVTVTGINAATPITVTGGTLLINGEVSTAATVVNGDRVAVRVVAPTAPGGTATATVTIGGLTSTFTVQAAEKVPDITPEPFTFTPQRDAQAGAVITSNAVTVSGIDSAAPITVTGGTLLINGQVSTATTVANGDQVAVRVTAPATPGATAAATVTIGGVPGTFTVQTTQRAPDTTPEPFAFAAQQGVQAGTAVTSNVITVSGIDAATPITVTGGTLLINGQVSTATTVVEGDRVAVRVTAVATPGGTATATVTIGGVSSTFTVQTVQNVDLTGEWVLNLNPTDTPSSTGRRIWLNVFESEPTVRGAGYAGYIDDGGQFIEPYSGQLSGTVNGSQYTLTLFIYDFYATNTDVKYEFRGTLAGGKLSGTWTRTDTRLGAITGRGTYVGTPTSF